MGPIKRRCSFKTGLFEESFTVLFKFFCRFVVLLSQICGAQGLVYVKFVNAGRVG